MIEKYFSPFCIPISICSFNSILNVASDWNTKLSNVNVTIMQVEISTSIFNDFDFLTFLSWSSFVLACSIPGVCTHTPSVGCDSCMLFYGEPHTSDTLYISPAQQSPVQSIWYWFWPQLPDRPGVIQPPVIPGHFLPQQQCLLRTDQPQHSFWWAPLLFH